MWPKYSDADDQLTSYGYERERNQKDLQHVS